MRQMPEFEDVSSDLQLRAGSSMLTIDRGTAARFGITPSTIDNALYDAFGQRIASTYLRKQPVPGHPQRRPERLSSVDTR